MAPLSAASKKQTASSGTVLIKTGDAGHGKMAKHHPDLIFCRKQAGVGELRTLTMKLIRRSGAETITR